MKRLGLRISLCCAIVALVSCLGLASCTSSDGASSEEENANVYLQGTTNLHIDGVYCYTEDGEDAESTYIRFSNEGWVRGITCDNTTTAQEAYGYLENPGGEFSTVLSADSLTTKASIDEGTTVDGGDLQVDTVEFVLTNANRGITEYYSGTVQDDAIDFSVETVYEDSTVSSWKEHLEESGVPMSDSGPETYTYSFIHVDPETTQEAAE